MTSAHHHHRALRTRESRAARVATTARFTLALLTLSPCLLLAQNRVSEVGAGALVQKCIDLRATDAPARLDSVHTLYVEQETVSAQADGRVLVAGEPAFLWKRTGIRHEFIPQDSIVGMVLTPPRTVRALITPLRGRSLTSMRSVALPDGWWLVTFAEVIPAQLPKHPKVLALWAGETDGTSWRAVERLPSVPDSLEIRTYSTSPLAYRDGHVLFAMQSTRSGQPRVVLYERRADGWMATSTYFGNRAYVVTAETNSHALLAVVRNDSTEQEDMNSLFVYARSHGDSTWTMKSRLVRGFRTPVWEPRFDTRSDGVLLTWRATSEDRRDATAWSMRLDGAGEAIGPIQRIASDATLIYHAPRGDVGVWVATNNRLPLDRLQLIEHDARAVPMVVNSSVTRDAGILGAAITRNFLVLIASRRGTSPHDPAVISLIRSYPWRCQ